MTNVESGSIAPVKVVIVEEFVIFSEALGRAISIDKEFDYVGSASTPAAAVELVTRSQPDVAVIDIDVSLPGDADFDGIDVTEQIKVTRPETRILILSGRMDLDSMSRAASAGACGFLSKESTIDEVFRAIRTAREGGMFVEAELIVPLVERLSVGARRSIGGGSTRVEVTPREQEVLTMLGEGLDVTVIARRLGITISTCRGHVKNLLTKLGSHSQLEAVVEAVHQGLLPHLSR